MGKRRRKKPESQITFLEGEENPALPAAVKPAGEPVQYEWMEIPPIEDWPEYPLNTAMLKTTLTQWNYLVKQVEGQISLMRRLRTAVYDESIPITDAWDLQDESYELWPEYERLVGLLYRGCPQYMKWYEIKVQKRCEILYTRLRVLSEEDELDIDMLVRLSILEGQKRCLKNALDKAIEIENREEEAHKRKSRWRPAVQEEVTDESIPF